jgi:hypothetical protein
VAQTVTVTGANDDLIDGPQTSSVALAINDAGSDDHFDALADQTVPVTTADNDVAGFTVVETGGSTAVSESGTQDTFTVVLTAQPDSHVVIDVTSGDIGEAMVSPAQLTFTSSNWNVAQTVTVTGANDDLIDGPQTSSVTLAINDAGSDDHFDALVHQNVSVTTADNDTAGFVTINQAAGQDDPTNASPVNFTVVFSEPVTGFDANDVLLGGTAAGTLTVVLTGSGTTYNVAVSGMTGSGTVTASVSAGAATDAAGNPNVASTSADNTVTYDTTAPTADIVDVTPDPRDAPVASVTIAFNEAVTGFNLADLTLKRDGGSNLLTGSETLSTSDNATYTLGGLTGLTAMPGVYEVKLTVAGSGIRDAAGNALAADASDSWTKAATVPTVIDDGDSGYSESGLGWVRVSSVSFPGYADDWRYHAAGTGGNAATWAATGLTPGQYEVLVTWAPYSNRATNAPFTVCDGAAVEGVFPINQQAAPRADATLGGRPFQRLGTFNITASSLRVTLSDQANGYVIADAVQLLRVGEVAEELTVALAADQAPERSSPLAATVTRSGGTAEALVVGLASSDASAARVPATVTIAAGASSATFSVTVVDDAVADGTQTARITASASGFLSGSDTLLVTDDDAVIVDDGDPVGYSDSGASWGSVSAATYPGYGGDWRYHAAGTGSHWATWTATDLAPGLYQVLVTWSPHANRAAHAPFAVCDGTEAEGTYLVNQQVEPRADATVGGRPFQLLGTFNLTASSARVTLSDQADGYVIADAVQFVRVGDLREMLGVDVSVDQAPEGSGPVTATVTRTGATDAAVEVRLSSSDPTAATVPATVTIPAGAASATFAVTVVDDAAGDGTQTTTIRASADGLLPGWDTLHVTDNDALLVDDGDPVGYSERGWGWFSVTSDAHPGYGGDWRYHAPGSGSAVATWSATGVLPGRYEVLVTWAPYSNRATNAPFTVYDGTAVEGVFPINQQNSPTAHATVGGRPFQRLGTFNVSGSSLGVTLSDQANGYVIADAVQFVRVGELAKELTVAISADQASEASGTVGATVTRLLGTDGDLVVSLTSSVPSVARVPDTVTIPAGAESAPFTVNLVDDWLANGTQTVTIRATAEGYLPGTDTLQVTDNESLVVDDGDSGYSDTGASWVRMASEAYPGYGGDWRYHARGEGSHVARWSATGLEPGQYQVLVTWSPHGNRATNSPFTVYDGTTVEQVYAVNQQVEPRSDATLDGRPFQRLGTFNISALSIGVTLSDRADGYVIADAVEFVRVGELMTNVLTVAIPGQAAEGDGTVIGTVTRSQVTAQPLEVSLTSSDTSEATVPATVTILAGQASATFAASIQDDALADGTQTVTITAAAAGHVSGTDTLHVLDNESWTIDDQDAGYSETPAWMEVELAAYPGYAGSGDPSYGDWRFQPAGTGSSVATWQVTTGRPGQYEIFVTWAPFANRATNAPYKVYDGPASGGVLEGTFPIDQELTPRSDATVSGRPFQRLGVFDITSNTLAVTLSNLANEYVIADAVQFARLGDLPLRAAGGAAVGWDSVPTGDPLTTDQALPLLAEAAALWQRSPHAPREDIPALAASVHLVIADLPDDLLGLASSSTNTIWLDTDAAGYGWFVDATPEDDDEFGDEPDAAVADRMDALSVIFHELGHLQGLADVDALLHPDDPMADMLAAGVRRTSSPADAAADHDAALTDLLGE